MTASAEASGTAGALHKRVPDFFIVGHPKCGTTALYEMLRCHPQIYMPVVKEPSFFVPEVRSRARRRNPVDVRHPHIFEDYVALFDAACPGQRIGEASPSYLWSRDAARRIADVRPDARIIAILREPASFLHSLHLQWVRNDIETVKDLRKALALEDARRKGEALPRNSTRPQWLLYSEHVRYVEQLHRYHAVFPREHVLVLIYEDFRADNEATVRTVLRFLDVDDTTPIEMTEVNPAVRVRSPRLSALVRSLYLGRSPASRVGKTAIKTVTPRRLRHGAIATQRRMRLGTPRAPDEKLMLELRQRFKGEVVALSEYLDRDLVTLWGYGSID